MNTAQPKARTRLLVIHRDMTFGSPEGHQVHGFEIFRQELLDRLNVDVTMAPAFTLDDAARAYDAHPSDVALVMISWKETPEAASAFFQDLSSRPGRGKIVFLDYYAPTSSPHFGVLPHVDRFAKRQVLRDLDEYQKHYEGGLRFTDFLCKELNYQLNGWNFSSRPDPEQVHKIRSAWNLGVTRRYMRLLKLTRPLAPLWGLRPFDLNMRVGKININPNKEWYQHYRELALEKLMTMKGRHRGTGTGPLKSRPYLAEMALCKIVLSPFGWGELCFRDYEAVAAGALLVKPSMEHLTTSPDIFRAGETSVPVRWDLADVEEKCDYYLSHPREAKAIIRNAQDVLHHYYTRGGFVDDVARIITFDESDTTPSS